MKHHVDIRARVYTVVNVHAMKAYRVVEVQIHSFLTSALDWRDRSAISPIFNSKKNRARNDQYWPSCEVPVILVRLKET